MRLKSSRAKGRILIKSPSLESTITTPSEEVALITGNRRLQHIQAIYASTVLLQCEKLREHNTLVE